MALVLICAALLALVHAVTQPRIEQNRARRFTESVQLLLGENQGLPPIRWDDDVWQLCNGQALVRGHTAGYGGPIRWLAAVSVAKPGPRLLGLAITEHQETPGIADFIAGRGEPWLQELSGHSFEELDQVAAVTGATITSRALVTAVRSALQHPGLEREGPCPH